MDSTAELNPEQLAADAVHADAGVLQAMTQQTPWWLVSVLLHALIIVLASLLSMSIALPEGDETVTITEIYQRAEIPPLDIKKPTDGQNPLMTPYDVPATDPTSSAFDKIVVSKEILDKAELSDHFETVNPDRPDTGDAFGNETALSFHLVQGSADEPGGGGKNGLDDLEGLIGLEGAAGKGTGNGSGGGDGEGWGIQKGAGMGSLGTMRGGGRKLRVKQFNGSRATENSVDLALQWLAYNQEPDGHWDAMKFGAGNKVDTAVTGLAALAFLGAGHSEKIGSYKDNVKRAINWLKSKQQPNGMIFDTSDAAGHRGGGYPTAIATLAVVEAAGMGGDRSTREAAQKAIDYVCETHQAGEGSDKLGWRYAAKTEADTSVTGWFVMALKSAKVSGIKVPTSSLEGAMRYLDMVEVKEAGGSYGAASQYKYQVNNAHAHTAHRLTAIGTLCRQFLGWKKDELQASVEWFVNKGGVPQWGANGERVDLYYWYYGSLCTFQQTGEIWNRWNEGMKKALTENQCKNGADAGSWPIVGDFSGEWGRVGQTALGALCLEVYYRYSLMNQ